MKVKNLPAITALADDDLFYVVDDSQGVNGGRKIKKSDLKSTLGATDDHSALQNLGNDDHLQYLRTDGTRQLSGNWDVGARNITNIAEVRAITGMFFQDEQVLERAARTVYVRKNPTSGQFSSVKAAIDSITDAVAGDPVVIEVAPGDYVEDAFTLKPFVLIRGQKDATVIRPSDLTQDFITAVETSIISELTLEGPTTAGRSMIKMVGGAGTGRFIAKNCVLGRADRYMTIDSSGGIAIAEFDLCQTDFTADVNDAFVVEGNGIGILGILSLIGIYRTPAVSLNTYMNISGSGNVLLTAGAALVLEGGATANNAVEVTDGGTFLSIGPSFLGNIGKVLSVPNVGNGPVINITAFGAVGATTKDIEIVNPNATGFISGAFDRNKIEIDANAQFSLFGAETSTSTPGTTTIGDIVQGATQPELVNLSKFTREGGVVGLLSGGTLTAGATFTLNYDGGTGFTNDGSGVVQEVAWNAGQLVLAANSDNFIVVDSAGNVTAQASQPNLQDRIVLGRVVCDGTAIRVIVEELASMVHQGNEVEDFLRDILGSVYATGSTTTENGTTDRRLDVTAGKYAYGTKKFNPSGGIGILWDALYSDGASGVTIIDNQAQVDNARFDDGSGTLQNIPGGQFAKHSVYVSGDGANEKYFLVYAQQTFATQTEAEQGPLPTPFSFVRGGITLMASAIVKQGQSPLVQVRDERPRIGFTSSGVSAASVHGNLLGLLNDDHPQYFRADGARIATGNFDMGGFSITNALNFNGVVVEAHASRHNPLGLDPLATATPVSIGALSNNTEGTANSFARSDHIHDIATASPVSQTPDQTNAEGVSNSLARADHVHNIPASVPVSLIPDQANAEGSANDFARSDHVHNVPAGSPVTNLDGGTSNAEGTANDFARSDHSHAINTEIAGNLSTVNAGDTADAGTSSNLARGDHQHPVATGTPVSQTPDQANAEGVSTDLARSDHVHNIPAATPVDVGSANAEGVAASFARSDHVHNHGNQAGGALHAAATPSVNGFMSAADKTKLNALFLGTDYFQADQFENPVNANWVVNALAPAAVDSLNNGLTVRLFDDTTEEGIGFSAYIPVGATNVTIRLLSRALTAPPAARTVGLSLYERGVVGGVDAWSAANTLADIDIATNTNWVEDSQTLTLAALGLTAGQVHQFELTRVAPQAGVNLVGDWGLQWLRLEFS